MGRVSVRPVRISPCPVAGHVAQPLHLEVIFKSVVAKVALQTADNRLATTARSAVPQVYATETHLVTDRGINSKCTQILLRNLFEELDTIMDKCVVFRIIIIIGFTSLGGPWTPQAIVASDLYPGHPPTSFYNPVSLRLPLPCQSVLIPVGHILVDLQGLSTISF